MDCVCLFHSESPCCDDKSRKTAIESLGFKYFKRLMFFHMHLMAFSKISFKALSDLVRRMDYPFSRILTVWKKRKFWVIPVIGDVEDTILVLSKYND